MQRHFLHILKNTKEPRKRDKHIRRDLHMFLSTDRKREKKGEGGEREREREEQRQREKEREKERERERERGGQEKKGRER